MLAVATRNRIGVDRYVADERASARLPVLADLPPGTPRSGTTSSSTSSTRNPTWMLRTWKVNGRCRRPRPTRLPFAGATGEVERSGPTTTGGKIAFHLTDVGPGSA
jgi:hypothetical protein